MDDSRTPAIWLSNIRKTFGTVIANDDISLKAYNGEILALLGENGSGKTTLMNVLSGIYKPDSGEISVNGNKVVIESPEDSKRLGIGMIHQHFKLISNFSAADNIWIGADGEGMFLTEERNKKIKIISEKFGFEINPQKLVSDMSVSEKQTVEILKVLYYGADILVLDEPTAVLTVQETEKLFSVLRRMRDEGCAIIIITHKLNEVMAISDKVSVLHKGKSVGTVITGETSPEDLTNLMVGYTVSLSINRPEVKPGETILSVENLCVKNEENATVVNNVSFGVRSGEIVGIAGVAGSGQKELCEAIAGLKKISSGTVLYKNEVINEESPRKIIKRGISMSFIPEDRLGMGLAPSLSITDNMILKSYCTTFGPFVNRNKAKKLANKVVNELSVSTPSIDIPVRLLSGGNVQKILLGREIQNDPNVIVTAYPVRGLDINSSYTIYDILNAQKSNGTAILYIGEDIDVLLELCDKIIVMCHGEITGVVDPKATTKEQIGLLMTNANNESLSQNDNGEVINRQSSVTHKKHSDAAVRKHGSIFRVSKRDSFAIWKQILFYIGAFALALFITGLLLFANDVNAFDYFKTVLTISFSNPIYSRILVSLTAPLILTSLGVATAFKLKFWNLGANGQYIAGAVCAVVVNFLIGDSCSHTVTLILMGLAAAIGGGLFGLIPAILKVQFGTNETLLTLMLNYIAYHLLRQLKFIDFFRSPSPRPEFKALNANGFLTKFKLFGIDMDASIFIALFFVIALFVYYKYSKHGYEIAVIGDSENTARYAGMNVRYAVSRTLFLSAALIGFTGMLYISGIQAGHRLGDEFTRDIGWTAVIVAYISKFNPFAILGTSFIMVVFQRGASIAESTYNVSSSMSDILQGIILFSVLACDFLIRYKISVGKKAVK